MYLPEQQKKTYEEKGFVLLDSLLCADQIEAITAKLSNNNWEDTPGTVWEEDNKTLRAIHEDPTQVGVLEKVSKHPKLVEPAMQILGSQVYIHQLKVNFKAAFSGDVWPWHQDFIYWHEEDGMPAPRAINAAIFLDEVTEFNGPLYLIPGSHKEGTISSLNQTKEDSDSVENNDWISSFKSNLKYTNPEEAVARLVEENGIEAPKGQAGSVLLFHPNCVHSSSNNISPFPRTMALITYNSVQNIPVAVENPRPDFLVGRDYRGIKPLAEQELTV
ncbi:phytanoyl-CoA dioxygenase family protein [Nodularia harveyana UHCC-0300]|uniref:Phytanoyl-CoA dioxygenase family protein n=1 Tax=Nodularia harveyana UHCC-0300 TaxID=2974287 RepID=A0ABU5UDJ6_9CYAN|nr:phytanoyl-CoA dioxygenase family protein [Nodularia harveyana]MEA5581597.1 phytanoyl-CoA dioxygenase family protein [Nodularia harveyana UHCC-0300]